MPQPVFTKPAMSDQRSTEAKPSNMSQLGPRPKNSIISKSSSSRALPTGHVEGADTAIAPPSPVHPGRRDINYYTLCSTQLPCYKSSRLPGADVGASGQPVLVSCSPPRPPMPPPHPQAGRESHCVLPTGTMCCSGWATPLHVTFLISGVSF